MVQNEFNVRWLLIVPIALGILILLNPVVIVPAGYRGVVLTWGEVTSIMPEGLSWRIPFVQSVNLLEVRTQKYSAEADSASADLQGVKTTVALNFHLDPSKVGEIYKNIGLEFEDRIIAPAIQEGVKASTAKYTAEELITKRELVKGSIQDLLKTRLAEYGLIVEAISITDFQFSEVFDTAIEKKVQAEQDALAAKNKLEQIKYEAQQSIETAKGQAESIRIINEELERSPKYLNLKSIEKWNGVLPAVVGGATPFIDISNLIAQNASGLS